MDKVKLNHTFIPLYQKLAECGEVRRVDLQTHKEVALKWDIYIDKIYAFLLTRFTYHNRLYMSYEYISAKTNISKDVVYKRVTSLRDFGIVFYKSVKRANGMQCSNIYTKVINILDDATFKCVSNKYLKNYNRKIQKRKEHIDTLGSIILSSSWTKEECINYWRNVNYELLTGTYLKGDKREKVLYLTDKKSVFREDLNPYEVEELLQNKEENY